MCLRERRPNSLRRLKRVPGFGGEDALSGPSAKEVSTSGRAVGDVLTIDGGVGTASQSGRGVIGTFDWPEISSTSGVANKASLMSGRGVVGKLWIAISLAEDSDGFMGRSGSGGRGVCSGGSVSAAFASCAAVSSAGAGRISSGSLL